MLWFFIISDFHRFINSCIALCIHNLHILNLKNLTIQWFDSEWDDPRKPNVSLIWSIIYWFQNYFFLLKFSSIILELFLSLHTVIVWLYKEINTSSQIALNIKSIYGFKIFYFKSKDLLRFILKWKNLSKNMKVSYTPIELSVNFVMNSSENITQTWFLPLSGHTLNNNSSMKVYALYFSVIKNPSQTIFIFSISLLTTGTIQQYSLALQIDKCITSIDK